MFTSNPPLRSLFRETHELEGQLQDLSERSARPLGLTAARAQALEELLEQPRIVAQLARRLGLARQSVQRTVDAMYREQLVHFEPNPDHRSARLVRLTSSAQRALSALHDSQDSMSEGLATDLSEQELGTATRLLRWLRQRMAGVLLPTS